MVSRIVTLLVFSCVVIANVDSIYSGNKFPGNEISDRSSQKVEIKRDQGNEEMFNHISSNALKLFLYQLSVSTQLLTKSNEEILQLKKTREQYSKKYEQLNKDLDVQQKICDTFKIKETCARCAFKACSEAISHCDVEPETLTQGMAAVLQSVKSPSVVSKSVNQAMSAGSRVVDTDKRDLKHVMESGRENMEHIDQTMADDSTAMANLDHLLSGLTEDMDLGDMQDVVNEQIDYLTGEQNSFLSLMSLGELSYFPDILPEEVVLSMTAFESFDYDFFTMFDDMEQFSDYQVDSFDAWMDDWGDYVDSFDLDYSSVIMGYKDFGRDLEGGVHMATIVGDEMVEEIDVSSDDFADVFGETLHSMETFSDVAFDGADMAGDQISKFGDVFRWKRDTSSSKSDEICEKMKKAGGFQEFVNSFTSHSTCKKPCSEKEQMCEKAVSLSKKLNEIGAELKKLVKELNEKAQLVLRQHQWAVVPLKTMFSIRSEEKDDEKFTIHSVRFDPKNMDKKSPWLFNQVEVLVEMQQKKSTPSNLKFGKRWLTLSQPSNIMHYFTPESAQPLANALVQECENIMASQ